MSERDAVLTRFIDESNKLDKRSPKAFKAKPVAFMPRKATRELSVYITGTLTESEIWRIGVQYVAGARGKTLYGRADVVAYVALDLGLKVQRNDLPITGHANVVGWPDDRGEQAEWAMKLAEKSKYSGFTGTE